MLTFRLLTISTLAAVFILILVGGIVRSTGSGMGCPDWPKCFGAWVPPSSVEQLPENYKEIYSQYRNKKNQRFAKYLFALGMDDTANGILNDKSILVESDFNPLKTKIEYVNRLIGVLIGFLIIAVALFSLKFWKTNRSLTILSVSSLALVIFQGWIGSFVVSTNLTQWTITLHLLLAFLLVALLVAIVDKTGSGTRIYAPLAFWWTVVSIALLLVQVLLGTQVREAIDMVMESLPRKQWISAINGSFDIHRSFSWLVLLVHVALIVKLRKTQGLKILPLALMVLILATILSGVGMAYLGVPAFLQPVHLLLASLTFGLQLLLLLKLRRTEEFHLKTR